MLRVLVALSFLGLAACSNDLVSGPAPYSAAGSDGSSDSDDDARTSSKKKATSSAEPTHSTTSTTTSAPLTDVSCTGVTEPSVNVTKTAAGSTPAPIGGQLPQGIWLLSAVKRENPSALDPTTKTGMVQVMGNRIAWDDSGICSKGTYTTNGNQLTITIVSDDDLNGDTETLSFSGTSTSLILNRSGDEEYDYAPAQ